MTHYSCRVAGATLLVSALAAFPVLAACPVGLDDARKGIALEFDDKTASKIYLRGNGMVEEWSTAPPDAEFGAYVSVTFSQHGVWLTEIAEARNGAIDQDSRSTITYTEGIADIAPFGPERQWTGAGVRDQGTVFEVAETHLITSGTETTLVIGACSYTIYPIRIEYRSSGDRFTDFLFAFPELGITAFVGSQSDTDFWNPKIVAIETLG